MPASRGAMSGARMASAPMAPSTWNQSFSSLRDGGQRRQIVDGAGIDRAGRADDEERRQPRAAVLRDRRVERGEIDSMQCSLRRNDMQRRGAEAGQIHRLAKCSRARPAEA